MSFKRSLRNDFGLLGICLIIIGAVVFYFKTGPAIEVFPVSAPTSESFTFAKVIQVIDGDTIIIDTGQHVRYIGMDTPEIETKQCFATESSELNRELVEGREVKLVKDVSDKDKYGRLLRFVYVGNVFVNDELLKEGAAKVETVPPDTGFKEQFESSQNKAKENRLGLWGTCF